ncbi:MAG TPA: hypothetical protein VKD72_00080 [Gemmataceae bacterium]|nr:hypothetical protein [Gemmataceae bacterium]
MPTKRTRRSHEHRPTLDTPRTRERLLTGHDWSFREGQFLDDDAVADAWELLREPLLAEHIAAHPGSRPWGWWRFDAVEARRQLLPGPESVGAEQWFGKPRCYKGIPPDGMFESERAYLTRLDLLSDAERRILAG